MSEEFSIVVKNLSKTFKIKHEQPNSIFSYFSTLHKQKKSVEELTILKDMSFSIKKGETVGIIGLNGCGKSTLLKILTRIYHQDSGTVQINGNVTPFLELGTGLNGELTARENIIIYGIILGLSKKQMMNKIDEIARFGEIQNFLDTKLKNFSAGMNARLAFSTAIHVEPDIMLIDEVLSVGDLSFQKKCTDVFLDFKKKNKTILFVSHSITQVKSLSDRVLWLHEGAVNEFGDPDLVIEKYRKFVTMMQS
ncbi:MAG: ABC transporter ATP-binding protein [Nitrosarchaeum sp.]